MNILMLMIRRLIFGLFLPGINKMDLIDMLNLPELSPVNDDVDLDALDFQVLPWLMNNNNEDPSERKANQHDICDKTLSENSENQKHQRIHNGEKSHECEYCNKRFAYQSTLVQHRRMHTEEKPYNCDFCNKSFKRSSSLKIHRIIHTGERTAHECEFCKKRVRKP